MPLTHANRLARICAYSAQAPQWDEFVREITPVVSLAARRVCAVWGDTSRSTVNEIVQEVFLKLCEDERRVLREFEDRGNDSFLKLLRVITASVSTDYFRRERAEKRGGNINMVPLEAQTETQTAPEHLANRARRQGTDAVEWPTLMAQLDGLLLKNAARISPRDRSLFWLYYRHGLTSDAISRIPAIGLSAKGVESALARISRVLRTSILTPSPPSEPQKPMLKIIIPGKGFSRVVAIDSMKHR